MDESLNFELYTKEIIEETMNAYHDIEPFSQLYVLKLDIDRAMENVLITGQMRELIFWYFGMQLNYISTLRAMNIIESDFTSLYDDLFEILEASLNGRNYEKMSIETVEAVTLEQFILNLHTRHINPFQFKKIIGIKDKLVELNDQLIMYAAGMLIDRRGEYTGNISGLPVCKVVAPTGHRKTASNDEFYRSDLRNNVFWGDESLMLAEIVGNRI